MAQAHTPRILKMQAGNEFAIINNYNVEFEANLGYRSKDKRTERKGNVLKRMILTRYIPIKTVTYGVYVCAYVHVCVHVHVHVGMYGLISEVNI